MVLPRLPFPILPFSPFLPDPSSLFPRYSSRAARLDRMWGLSLPVLFFSPPWPLVGTCFPASPSTLVVAYFGGTLSFFIPLTISAALYGISESKALFLCPGSQVPFGCGEFPPHYLFVRFGAPAWVHIDTFSTLSSAFPADLRIATRPLSYFLLETSLTMGHRHVMTMTRSRQEMELKLSASMVSFPSLCSFFLVLVV